MLLMLMDHALEAMSWSKALINACGKNHQWPLALDAWQGCSNFLPVKSISTLSLPKKKEHIQMFPN